MYASFLYWATNQKINDGKLHVQGRGAVEKKIWFSNKRNKVLIIVNDMQLDLNMQEGQLIIINSNPHAPVNYIRPACGNQPARLLLLQHLRVLRYHQMTPGVPPNTSVETVSITYPLISLIKRVRHPNEVFGGTLGDTWCQMYYQLTTSQF